MLTAAAFGVGYIAPITVWTCDRAAGAVSCSIAERDLGLIELQVQQLANVQSVHLETQVVAPTSGSLRTPGVQKRIVFLNANGDSIRTFGWDYNRLREWFGPPRVASTDIMFEEFERFLSDDTQVRHSTWGAFFVPLILVGVLLLLSLLMLLITAASMFVRPEWAQERMEELRKRTRNRRR